MGAEGGLLEEPGHEPVIFDIIDVLLLEGALSPPEAEAELGVLEVFGVIGVFRHREGARVAASGDL